MNQDSSSRQSPKRAAKAFRLGQDGNKCRQFKRIHIFVSSFPNFGRGRNHRLVLFVPIG
jgi:hypothetical protein